MSATSREPSPCAERRSAKVLRSRGAALLMAILTVALIASVSSAIIAEHSAAIEQLGGRSDQAQARWLTRASVDWARNVLEWWMRRYGSKTIDTPESEWATKVPPMPIDEGEVSGEMVDLSSRFNINSLVKNGIANPGQQTIFLRLLDNLGIPASQAQSLSAAITDWIDTDENTSTLGAETNWYTTNGRTVYPPQAPLIDINELLAVRGMSSELLERLRPYITALPDNATTINVNIASAEVIAAFVGNLPLAQARTIVSNRQGNYFQDVSTFIGLLPQGSQYNTTQFDVKSQYFLVTGRAHWGDATAYSQVLLYREGVNNPRPVVVRETIL